MPAPKSLLSEKDPQVIIDLGYRVVSRKLRRVSRIDRSDWKKILKQKANIIVDESEYTGWPDHYRRSYSKDKFTLHESIDIRQIPNSGLDLVEFVEGTHKGWRSLKNERNRILRAISNL